MPYVEAPGVLSVQFRLTRPPKPSSHPSHVDEIVFFKRLQEGLDGKLHDLHGGAVHAAASAVVGGNKNTLEEGKLHHEIICTF